MFCEKCGMELQNGWTNCPRCGTSINESGASYGNVQQNITENNERRYSFADWIRFRLLLAGIGIIIMIILVLIMAIFC